MSFISKLLGVKDPAVERAEAAKRAIREEAKIGGTVFGEIPKGVRREFFCLDERTWIWHEEWKDDQGSHQIRTTRYDIRPHGIFKAQNGQEYKPVSMNEALNLRAAIIRYNELIDSELAPVLYGPVSA